MDRELIRHIIRVSNDAGFRGMKIVDWIPPVSATEDWHGSFVYECNFAPICAKTEEKAMNNK